MRKEVIIAIILGLAFGFVITYGIYRTRVAMRNVPSSDSQAAILNTPAAVISAPAIEQDLVIHNPDDGLITAGSSSVVTGTSQPNAPVVLLVNSAEYISSTDDDGNFSFDVPLKQGANVLTLYVLREDGSAFTDQRTVVMGDFKDLFEATAASGSAT